MKENFEETQLDEVDSTQYESTIPSRSENEQRLLQELEALGFRLNEPRSAKLHRTFPIQEISKYMSPVYLQQVRSRSLQEAVTDHSQVLATVRIGTDASKGSASIYAWPRFGPNP